MALIKCPECGKEISDNANKCPNCGNPMYVKKKHSPLGIVSAVMCGISILFPTPEYIYDTCRSCYVIGDN